MSILIDGLDMPTEYGRCIVIFPDGRVTTEFGSQVIAKAVPVPPHGRLGDLDRLENELQSRLEKEGDGWMASEIKLAQRVMRVADYKIIKSAPTIIEAEPPKEETE